MSDPTDQTLLSLASQVVDRAMSFATEHELRLCVVVLDATFTPVALARSDGAYASTVAVATAKAHTALNFGAPTHVLRDRIVAENQRALSAVEPRLMFVGGGMPLVRGDRRIGSVGISGGSEDQDVACALHAVEGLPS
jgi:uncharacterized protein GlcG (DUF336 family)